jgi:hypothetical protein
MTNDFKPTNVTDLVRTVQKYRELLPQVGESDRALAALKQRSGDNFNEVNQLNHRIHSEFDGTQEDLNRLVKVIGANAVEIEAAVKVVATLRAALK